MKQSLCAEVLSQNNMKMHLSLSGWGVSSTGERTSSLSSSLRYLQLNSSWSPLLVPIWWVPPSLHKCECMSHMSQIYFCIWAMPPAANDLSLRKNKRWSLTLSHVVDIVLTVQNAMPFHQISDVRVTWDAQFNKNRTRVAASHPGYQCSKHTVWELVPCSHNLTANMASVSQNRIVFQLSSLSTLS